MAQESEREPNSLGVSDDLLPGEIARIAATKTEADARKILDDLDTLLAYARMQLTYEQKEGQTDGEPEGTSRRTFLKIGSKCPLVTVEGTREEIMAEINFLREYLSKALANPRWDNEYFNGKVRSRKMVTMGKRATIGEIDPGTYQFPTEEQEKIEVIVGTIFITLPGESEKQLDEGDEITIPPNTTFTVRVADNEGWTTDGTSSCAVYECIYG